MRTRHLLTAFAIAAGTAASAITGAHNAPEPAVVNPVPAPVRAATVAPVVVSPSTSVVTPPTTEKPTTTTTAQPTWAPRSHQSIDDSHRDDAVTIETADNGGFFTVGDGPKQAGSATTSEDTDDLVFYAYCSGDDANTLVCSARLTNESDKVVRFPNGLTVLFKVTPRDGDAITVEGHVDDVIQLVPGETAELRTHDTRTLAPGAYEFTATTNVIW